MHIWLKSYHLRNVGERALRVIRSRQMSAFLTRHATLLALSLGVLSAADISGLWSGQVPGRFGEPEDISFQFKVNGTALTGKLFGNEFDLPLEEGSVLADKVTFTITTTNYYSREKVRFQYSGMMSGNEIELTREREKSDKDKDAKSSAKAEAKPKPFKLKRLTSRVSAEVR